MSSSKHSNTALFLLFIYVCSFPLYYVNADQVEYVPLIYVLQSRLQYLSDPVGYMKEVEKARRSKKGSGKKNSTPKHIDNDHNEDSDNDDNETNLDDDGETNPDDDGEISPDNEDETGADADGETEDTDAGENDDVPIEDEAGDEGDDKKLERRSENASAIPDSTIPASENMNPQNSWWSSSWFGSPTEDIQVEDKMESEVNTISNETGKEAQETVSNNDEGSSWYDYLPFSDSTAPKNAVSNMSPFAMLNYMSSGDQDSQSLMSMYNFYSDPANDTYLGRVQLFMQLTMYFMPKTGIIDQISFSMSMTKLMWRVAILYFQGQDTSSILMTELPAIMSITMMRRDEASISNLILEPGQTVNIESMDVEMFIKYVSSMNFPYLDDDAEAEIRNYVLDLITSTFPNINSDILQDELLDALINTSKFLSLINIEGNLKVPETSGMFDFFSLSSFMKSISPLK